MQRMLLPAPLPPVSGYGEGVNASLRRAMWGAVRALREGAWIPHVVWPTTCAVLDQVRCADGMEHIPRPCPPPLSPAHSIPVLPHNRRRHCCIGTRASAATVAVRSRPQRLPTPRKLHNAMPCAAAACMHRCIRILACPSGATMAQGHTCGCVDGGVEAAGSSGGRYAEDAHLFSTAISCSENPHEGDHAPHDLGRAQ